MSASVTTLSPSAGLTAGRMCGRHGGQCLIVHSAVLMRAALLLLAAAHAQDAGIWSDAGMCESPAASHAALLQWFLEMGGEIAPLEYRDRGMFATERIEKGQLLVRAPTTIAFPYGESADNLTAVEMANEIYRNCDPKWHSYLSSLPKTCQSPVCGSLSESVRPTLFLESFIEQVQNTVPRHLRVAYSVATSRRFTSVGMLPVFDLFNHVATDAHEAGDRARAKGESRAPHETAKHRDCKRCLL